jgi:hypothetical protein
MKLTQRIIRVPKIVLLVGTIALLTSSLESLEYEARYQPELENVTLDTYIRNPRLFNIQVQCLIYDGPCDIVGRFLKRE